MNLRSLLSKSMLRHLHLLELLHESQYGLPTDTLIKELQCSLPVLLNDIRLINEEQDIAQIEKYKGLHQLKMQKSSSVSRLYAEFLRRSSEFQIFEALLYEQHDNITELAGELYLSVSNTQRYLKKIQAALKEIGVELKHRPLRLEGKESTIRQLYYRYFSEKNYQLEISLPTLTKEQQNLLIDFVKAFLQKNGFLQKHIFVHRLVYNLYISLWRIKNHHHFSKWQLQNEGIALPTGSVATQFQQLVFQAFNFAYDEQNCKDSFWLLYSDSLILNTNQLAAILQNNERGKTHFAIHQQLVAKFSGLLTKPLTKEEQIELSCILQNFSFLYATDGTCVNILRLDKKDFVVAMAKIYPFGVEKIKQLVTDIATSYHFYFEKDFIIAYVYWLITFVPDWMEKIKLSHKRLKILLLSSLSPTAESYLAMQITKKIYGNFEIVQGNQAEKDFMTELRHYDLILTTEDVKLDDNLAVLHIDSYLSWHNIFLIQEKVSELTENMTELAEKVS